MASDRLRDLLRRAFDLAPGALRALARELVREGYGPLVEGAHVWAVRRTPSGPTQPEWWRGGSRWSDQWSATPRVYTSRAAARGQVTRLRGDRRNGDEIRAVKLRLVVTDDPAETFRLYGDDDGQ